jgi:hypothetical protein
MSVIERLGKMSDSQISDVCKKMKIKEKIKGKNDRKRKIKTLLLPLISSYSFGDNIMVTFTEKKFPEYEVRVIVKDIIINNTIIFKYNVCKDTFVKILTEIKNVSDTENVFSKIIKNRKKFCKKFSEHVNNIKKVCEKVQTPNRIFKILPNPITCERLR